MNGRKHQFKPEYNPKFVARFFKYVRLPIDGSTECWEWTGGKYKDGYGNIWHLESGVQRRAHRIAWEILHGKAIPDGLLACHTCDHKWCVNPFHIFIETNAGNIRDCVSKRRHSESRKTHCKHGHPFSGDNLLVRGGKRFCRVCQKQKWTRCNHKRRGTNKESPNAH